MNWLAGAFQSVAPWHCRAELSRGSGLLKRAAPSRRGLAGGALLGLGGLSWLTNWLGSRSGGQRPTPTGPPLLKAPIGPERTFLPPRPPDHPPWHVPGTPALAERAPLQFRGPFQPPKPRFPDDRVPFPDLNVFKFQRDFEQLPLGGEMQYPWRFIRSWKAFTGLSGPGQGADYVLEKRRLGEDLKPFYANLGTTPEEGLEKAIANSQRAQAARASLPEGEQEYLAKAFPLWDPKRELARDRPVVYVRFDGSGRGTKPDWAGLMLGQELGNTSYVVDSHESPYRGQNLQNTTRHEMTHAAMSGGVLPLSEESLDNLSRVRGIRLGDGPGYWLLAHEMDAHLADIPREWALRRKKLLTSPEEAQRAWDTFKAHPPDSLWPALHRLEGAIERLTPQDQIKVRKAILQRLQELVQAPHAGFARQGVV